MALTGRAGLLALAGAVVVGVLLPSWWGILLVTGLVLAAVAVDVALAPSVRTLRLSRSGDTAVRLGETAAVATGRMPAAARSRGSNPPAWRRRTCTSSDRSGSGRTTLSRNRSSCASGSG